MSGDLAAIIYRAAWKLLGTDSFFVTPDAGLAMCDPQPLFPWSDAGVESLKSHKTLPTFLNLRTDGWAGNFIYGHSQEAVTRVRRLAKQRPGDVLHSSDASHAPHRL